MTTNNLQAANALKSTLKLFYDPDTGVWANNFGSFLNRGELGVEAFDADGVFIGMFADEDAACDAILARWEARSNGGAATVGVRSRSNGGASTLREEPDIEPEPALEPDRSQLESFIQTMFKHVTADTYVSLRAFPDQGSSSRPFRITPVKLNGGLDDLINQAYFVAELAARHREKVVFCPPVATFTNPKHAREADLAEGPVLSIECDIHPRATLAKLIALLGSPTMVVESGGVWTDPETGETEPKLHIYYRLQLPTRSKEEHQKLKLARKLATGIVGGDASNITVVHPIRWPGSVHRKGDPKLCRIVELNPDAEIELDTALEILRKAAGDDGPRDYNQPDGPKIATAEAFKHLDPNQRLAEGVAHRTAAIEEIRAAFAVIPNDNRGWDDWNKHGMALFRATEGSDDGLAVFHAWSSKSKKYDAQATADRWAAYKTCPPTEIGVGSIFYWANEASPGWEMLIGMSLEQAMKIAALIPLSALAYESKRKAVASELKMRVGPLEKIVEHMRAGVLNRADTGDNNKQKDAIIAKWNERHAHVLAGGKSCVLQEFKTPEGYTDFKLLTSAALHEWNAEHTINCGFDNKGLPVIMLATKFWMQHPKRRKYEDIGFFPEREVPGFYNLWRGFSVEPRKGDCSKFLAHMYENVCQENDELYAWVMAWFADIFQHPANKCGTSLTLRGKQGTGKTKVGEVMGSLLGVHYKPVAEPRFITGQFNSHMLSLLMLHADEGFWAGDKKAEGKLKDLITGKKHPIEFKGKEAFWVDNHSRLFSTGNPDWQVPAGFDERRFAVLDMGDAHRKDFPYFAAIDTEMEAGGREALLYHLLFEVDCSKVNLRQIPETTALLEQKLETASAEQGWWLDILQRGELPGYQYDKEPRNEVLSDTLFNDYIEHAKKQGVSRRVIETKLGIFLRKAVGPRLRRIRKSHTGILGSSKTRLWTFIFPPLSECRQAFIELHDQKTVLWEGGEGGWS